MSRAHDCAVDGCPTQIPRSRLMCKGHWYSVPRPIRNRLLGEWRKWLRDEECDYMVVREEAIEAAER